MQFLRRSFVCLALSAVVAFFAPDARSEEKSENLPPPPGALTRELSSGLPIPTDRASLATPAAAPTLSQPIEIPFILEGGHIIVDASIDGAAPKPFLFDTGGRNLIARDAASGLHAPVERTARIGGIGANRPGVDMIKVGRIAIGGAVLEQQNVGITELPNVILDRGARPRIAGLIGSELLLRYAVTIDYRKRMLTLNAPGFRPQAATFALPLGIAMSREGLSHPQITAELDGVQGDFIIDTGAGSQVVLFDKFQREHQPFNGATTTLHFLTPGGIGGHAGNRMGFLHQLRLGAHIHAPPLVSALDHGDSMLGGLSYVSGVIGNAVLADFVVTIDLAAAHAYFEPRADRVPSTTIFGPGMILDKPDHDGFEVIDVIAGSAADRAGLRRGDQIIAVAGHPARDLALADVHVFASKSLPPLAIQTADHRSLQLSYGHLLP